VFTAHTDYLKSHVEGDFKLIDNLKTFDSISKLNSVLNSFMEGGNHILV